MSFFDKTEASFDAEGIMPTRRSRAPFRTAQSLGRRRNRKHRERHGRKSTAQHAAPQPQRPCYLPKWEIMTMQSLWKNFIRDDLRCFRIRNSSFELIDRNGQVLKAFAKGSARDVLQFMLLEGIPGAHKMSPNKLRRLTEEVMMANVPTRLLSSAQRAGSGQKNGMTFEDTEILSNEKIVPLLESFGYRFSIFGDRIYSPPTVPTENCFFQSLEDLRVHIREQPSLPCVDASTMHPLLHRKRTLLIRIWAATSSRPLPKFRFDKFAPRRKPGRSFLQFEDELSCVEYEEDDEDELDDVWSVQSFGSAGGNSFAEDEPRQNLLTRLFGDDECGNMQFDCQPATVACPATHRIKARDHPPDAQAALPAKSLADLSLNEDNDDDVLDQSEQKEEIHVVEGDDDDGADSVVVRITTVKGDDDTTVQVVDEGPETRSKLVFLTDPVYSACEWVDFRCCSVGDASNVPTPMKANSKPVVSPESTKHSGDEGDNENETITSDDKSQQWSINDLQAENEKLRTLLEKLNPRKAHSGKLTETNTKLKAGIEFMKRTALLDEYSKLMQEYENLQSEATR